jgi:acetyl esterase/lipase
MHPELRMARFLPRSAASPRTLGIARTITALAGRLTAKDGAVEVVNADVHVRVFRPRAAHQPAPGLLYLHGGGYVLGSAKLGDEFCHSTADRLGTVSASVEYRLAPEHPFPAPLEDCYAALCWLAAQPDVDPDRIAVVGESAGGGLAAALVLLTKERGGPRPAVQALSYPMLDDRTAARTDIDARNMRMWNPDSNRFGWRSYLGEETADGDSTTVPPLAAPVRYADLSGLPPTWIGVGTNDLFHDEDVAYARRLEQAGVECVLHETPGAYHSFDLIERRTSIAREFARSRMDMLRKALHTDDAPQS